LKAKSHDLVRNYFNREASRFDNIYEDRKPALQRVVDRLFRAVVVERFQLICSLAPSPGSWSVLDAGCGSGRYALALAAQGATRVLGVDMADEMIRLARRHAAAAGVADRCEFQTSAFLDFTTDEKFDVVVATGYFDYLEDPARHLRKMLEHCRGRLFISVPKRWEYRVPIRKARFAWQRGYVRFYSRAEFLRIAEEAGADRDRIALVDLGRDWIAVIRA
jgi:2-polyprenyl-3-methyl-5-hydroxy-6-metoxy-1,4-benzoquinol methylase